MNPSEPESSPPITSGLQVELGAKPWSLGRAIWLVLVFVFLASITAAKLIGWSPNSSPTPSPLEAASTVQPAITWSPSSIEIILSPGEAASRSFTVTSSTDLTNVVIEAVSTVAPFLTIKPNIISKMKANKPQTVLLSFSIPTTATLGTYTGTIHLRVGSQTFPQTLKLSLQVWPLLSATDLGLTIKYPPTWIVRRGSSAVVFSNVQTPSGISDQALQTESAFEVRRLFRANVNTLPITEWFDQYFADGFATNLSVKMTISINGHSAVKIQTSEIGNRLHFYIANGQDVIEVVYGLFAAQFISTYESMLSTLNLF